MQGNNNQLMWVFDGRPVYIGSYYESRMRGDGMLWACEIMCYIKPDGTMKSIVIVQDISTFPGLYIASFGARGIEACIYPVRHGSNLFVPVEFVCA